MRHGNGTDSHELATGVSLPVGAKITGIEITGCDDSDTRQLESSLFECPDPTGHCARIAGVSSSGKPGCDFFSTSLADGPVINNLSNTYLLDIFLGPDQNLRLPQRAHLLQEDLEPRAGDRDVRRRADEQSVLQGHRGAGGVGNHAGLRQRELLPERSRDPRGMASFLARALGLFLPN